MLFVPGGAFQDFAAPTGRPSSPRPFSRCDGRRGGKAPRLPGVPAGPGEGFGVRAFDVRKNMRRIPSLVLTRKVKMTPMIPLAFVVGFQRSTPALRVCIMDEKTKSMV